MSCCGWRWGTTLRLVLANDVLAEAIASPALIGMLSAPACGGHRVARFRPALLADGRGN
jgi:hypothetical protein